MDITVLMPVHNGEKYLREAIESILSQTFTGFEFLIINDGSTDGSKNIIKSYKDSRIKLIQNEKNLGATISLNKGMRLAAGEYIARMDADDVSLPKRLETQVKFMDKNPEIGAVGTWAKIIGRKNKKYIKTYSDFEKIKAAALFKNVIIHPSVMIRKEMFNKYNLKYNEDLKYSQDYELWTRAIKYFPVANIKKILLLYRIHKENVSHRNSKLQIDNSNKTRVNQLENLKIMPTEEEKNIHTSTHKLPQYTTSGFLNKSEQWLMKLINQNNKIKYYKESQFSTVAASRWLIICNINAKYDFKNFIKFWKSPLREKLDFKDIENWKILTKFFLKCLLKKSII